jgi:hypothetical protein
MDCAGTGVFCAGLVVVLMGQGRAIMNHSIASY